MLVHDREPQAEGASVFAQGPLLTDDGLDLLGGLRGCDQHIAAYLERAAPLVALQRADVAFRQELLDLF